MQQNFMYFLTSLMPFTAPIFTKLALARRLFIKNSCAKFHEKRTNGLVAVSWSQTDGRTAVGSAIGFLFTLCTERPKRHVLHVLQTLQKDRVSVRPSSISPQSTLSIEAILSWSLLEIFKLRAQSESLHIKMTLGVQS